MERLCLVAAVRIIYARVDFGRTSLQRRWKLRFLQTRVAFLYQKKKHVGFQTCKKHYAYCVTRRTAVCSSTSKNDPVLVENVDFVTMEFLERAKHPLWRINCWTSKKRLVAHWKIRTRGYAWMVLSNASRSSCCEDWYYRKRVWSSFEKNVSRDSNPLLLWFSKRTTVASYGRRR